VLVLHERKTRLTLMTRLTGKTAGETVAAIMAVFRRLEAGMRGSITFDNDTCFAHHALLRGMLGATTYFCDAYASWQKAASRTPTAGSGGGCRAAPMPARGSWNAICVGDVVTSRSRWTALARPFGTSMKSPRTCEPLIRRPKKTLAAPLVSDEPDTDSPAQTKVPSDISRT
jgi:hypothetical protein